MCTTSKESKANQTAAQSAADAERQAGQANLQAGLEAQNKIISAGQPTSAETQRLNRYSTNAVTPGETLLQNQGAISQAVARRIQERVNQPGLDYDVNSPAFESAVGTPVWAALKARGIAAQPGDTTGGGLGTQQYMKTVVPALAQIRSNQINTDIATGQQYGQTATAEQNYFTDLENSLSEALRGRQVQSTQAGAPYATQGTQLQGQGNTAAEAINQAEVQSRYAKKDADKAAIGEMAAIAALIALTAGAAAPVAGAAGTAEVAGMGSVLTAPAGYYASSAAAAPTLWGSLAAGASKLAAPTATSLLLQKRTQANK